MIMQVYIKITPRNISDRGWKCIYTGEVIAPPNIGFEICVRNGFCCHNVKEVLINYATDITEVYVSGDDNANEYGDDVL